MKYKQPDKPTYRDVEPMVNIPDAEYLKLLKDVKRLAKQVATLKRKVKT